MVIFKQRLNSTTGKNRLFIVPYQVIKLVKEPNREYSAILNLVSFRETNTEVHEEYAVKNT